MARKSNHVAAGSGEVFVDLGYADAAERRLQVRLALQLNELVAQRRLTESKVAALFKISRQRAVELKDYRLSHFPSARLRHFLALV